MKAAILVRDRILVRESCRRKYPLNGVDAQALEHALTITERERDDLQRRLDEQLGRAAQVGAALEAGPVHSDFRSWAAALAGILKAKA